MALATPTISVQDGFANAAVNVAANAAAFITPGNQITVALQSTSGVARAEFVLQAPGTLLDGLRSPVFQGTPFSWSFTLPTWFSGTITINTEVTDGQNITSNANALVSYTRTQGNNVHKARNVVLSNVATLSSYTITAAALNDNVSGGNVQGDYVLLVAQSTASQNGLYVVGVVTSTTAPLTRVPDYATGNVLPAGQTCEIDAGTLFAQSTWKCVTTGPVTVDTTSTAWYPKTQTFSATSGSAISTLWLWTGPNAAVQFSQKSGSATASVLSAVAAGAGSGTATVTGAGTYYLTVTNW